MTECVPKLGKSTRTIRFEAFIDCQNSNLTWIRFASVLKSGGLDQEQSIIDMKIQQIQETAGSDRVPAPRCSRHIIAIQPTQEAIEEIPVILRHLQPFATHQISHTLPQAATRQVQVRYHPKESDIPHQANRQKQNCIRQICQISTRAGNHRVDT